MYPPLPENEEIVVPEIFSHFFIERPATQDREFAGMAFPTDRHYDLDKEAGLLTVDNGATTTLSCTLFNMNDVEKCSTKISLAGKGMSIQATHSGRKTYYIRDATGSIHKCTTRAFYVPDLDQDLLAGRALLEANYRVILDKDPKIAGIFPVTDGQIDQATGLPFADSKGLFYVETVPISETKYLSMSGYSLWHRRLGHATMQSIKDSIPHSIGLKELEKAKFDTNQKCTACMLGKAHLEIRPRSRDHATRPLEGVFMDIIVSSVRSIEGYLYTLVIVDEFTMYRWVYGLVEKSDASDMAKRWISDIAEIRAKTPLQI